MWKTGVTWTLVLAVGLVTGSGIGEKKADEKVMPMNVGVSLVPGYAQQAQQQPVYGQEVPNYGGQPIYQDTQATLANTIRQADCISTGVFCSNHETCCTKACKITKNRESRACCLPEGNLCDYGTRANPGIHLCCGGLQCMPMMSGDKKVSVCQVPVKKG